MSVELTCPACGAINAFGGDQAGYMGKCGQCHTPLYVPQPDEMPAPVSIKRPLGGGPVRRVLVAAAGVVLVSAAGAAGYFLGAGIPQPAPSPQNELASARPVQLQSSASTSEDGPTEQSKEETLFTFKA